MNMMTTLRIGQLVIALATGLALASTATMATAAQEQRAAAQGKVHLKTQRNAQPALKPAPAITEARKKRISKSKGHTPPRLPDPATYLRDNPRRAGQ